MKNPELTDAAGAHPTSVAVRICVFARCHDASWCSALAAQVPPSAAICLLGVAAGNSLTDSRFRREPELGADDAHSTLRSAAAKWPGEHLVVLRAGTVLPPLWFERLLAALSVGDVLVATPLDNLDPQRAPLPAGLSSSEAPPTIDALCYLYGRREVIDTSTFSPLLSVWHGERLRGIDVKRLGRGVLPSSLAPLRAVLLDHLYVADPSRFLRGPAPQVPGADPSPTSILGELRERVAAALAGDAAKSTFYPGLDGRPVVLHVLHGWGGGAERFVRDLAAADHERHHLVLTAQGNFPRRIYGESLQLYDGRMAQPALRRIVLPNPIRDTAISDTIYAEFLHSIVRDFAVDAIVVSSLIGHSLDALRSGLPTVLIGHDYYPIWPLLHRDFGDISLAFDRAQLTRDLRESGASFEFADHDAEHWHTLREAYVAEVLIASARIVAPSRSMLDNLLRLEPRFSTLSQNIIAHGLAAWPILPKPVVPPARGHLRLLMLGRVRRGKGAELLHGALPGLGKYAEVFLLGAGAEGEQFFGRANVHVVLNYDRDELPTLLESIAPDAALLLPTVAETFSYTLSELTSLGIPVIASNLGALRERIQDGVDGWLVAPDADAVTRLIADLHAHPERLVAAREALSSRAHRGLAEMLAEYAAVLPSRAKTRDHDAPITVTLDSALAQTRAGEIGDAQRGIVALKQEIAAQSAELERRADWAMGLDRDMRRARQLIIERDAHAATILATIDEHKETIESRTQWAREAADRESAARSELARFAEVHRQLQQDFDERTQWALSLDARLTTMHESTSWRLTEPLRFIVQKWRGLRLRIGMLRRRLLSAFGRTRGSLARRGLIGTLRRAANEIKRASAPMPKAIPVVAEPSHEFSPFGVPTSDTPRVSIVIPVYNKIDYTIACLQSLALHADTFAFETIVVDDGSSDATAERLAKVTGVRIVHNAQNLGFVGSCNAGAQKAKGEFVLFLNNDTVVTAGWLAALVQCFEQQPDAGLVGARLVYPDGRQQEAGGIVFSDGSGWNYGRFDDPADPRYGFRREADYCSGAAIMLPRELFEQLGGFDSRYAPAYYEDTDLAFAVRAAGRKVYFEPRSTVIHFEGITAGTDTSTGIKRYQVVNREKFLQKWKNELSTQPSPIDDPRHAATAANHRDRGHVLIIDSYTPTPDQDSGSLRMINLMRLLRDLHYRVSFLPDNRAHAGRYTQDLQALGVQALYHPFAGDIVAWMREHGRSLDALILSRHYVAANYVGLARLYAPQARLIFDTVDLHYLREERAATLENKPELARQAARTKSQELKLMRECDLTLVVSPVEQALLKRELPQARIEILSNVHEIYGCRADHAQRRDLVFVGGFEHPPNIDAVQWFVDEIFPLVRNKLPDLKFHIIGSKATPQVLALASDRVIVHGYVEDIAPFMDACRISVAPLRYGAGVKGKVNMAMSYGLPVVATGVAVEGMGVRADVDVLVADTPQTFADALLRLHDDAALWKMLSANGIQNVRRNFSFEAARIALERILPAR